MAIQDPSPSPPAAGSITVNTGPLPSTSAPADGSGRGREGADGGDREATTELQEPVAGTGTAAAAAASAGSEAVATPQDLDQDGQVDDKMDGVETSTPGHSAVLQHGAGTAAAPPPLLPQEQNMPAAKGSSNTAAPTAVAAEAAASTSTTAAAAATGISGDSSRGIARGAFIVFEGLDRAGKTTQAKLLQQRFIESGRDVKYMRFPDRTTPIGQMIDAYLRGETETEDHVIHLLFSANRWEAINRIKADLASGTTIICDRYYHSGIVYSAAKQLPSLSLSWAKAPEVGLPRPDLVLFLDLEESVARGRGGWGGEVYERGEMQRRVRELFWGLSMGDLSSKSGGRSGGGGGGKTSMTASTTTAGINVSGVPGRTPSTTTVVNEFRQEEEDIQIVDANLGVEELSDKVWEVIMPRVEAVERGEVGKTVRIVQ